jgi:predicted transcriptional regulator
MVMLLDRLSIYVPQEKLQLKPLERLAKLAKKRDRSINYMVVQAIIEYVEREERKEGT